MANRFTDRLVTDEQATHPVELMARRALRSMTGKGDREKLTILRECMKVVWDAAKEM